MGGVRASGPDPLSGGRRFGGVYRWKAEKDVAAKLLVDDPA